MEQFLPREKRKGNLLASCVRVWGRSYLVFGFEIAAVLLLGFGIALSRRERFVTTVKNRAKLNVPELAEGSRHLVT